MMTVHSKVSASLRQKQIPEMPEQKNGNKQDGAEIVGLLENQPWKHPTASLSIYLNRDTSLTENQLKLV